MDWERPYWAGFAVAFVSLATYGQTLNKAGMRMVGTMVAIPMAFLLIALFPQQRWGFMVGVSLWIAFCTYMMGGNQRAYFWQVAGFVTAIISFAAGPDPVNAFDIAMMRAQETGLGVLVYSIVASLLWPVRSGDQFRAAVGKLVNSQAALYKACRRLAREQVPPAETAKLVADMRQAHTRFQTLLEAAETDTYEVWEVRAQWQQFRQQVSALCNGLASWCDSVTNRRGIALTDVFPGLHDSDGLLTQRFSDILGMLDGRPPVEAPRALELQADRAALGALTPFERAAVIGARDRWLELERRTRAMHANVGDIAGFTTPASEAEPVQPPDQIFALDPDRMLSAARVFMVLWLAYLLWIYVPDLPGGTGVVSFAAPIGMILSTTPQLRVSQAFWPAFISSLAAGLIYIFIMPHLTSFLGLGLLLFVCTFAICYVFATPQRMLGKLFGVAMFLKVASIANEQTYSFMVVANTTLMLPTVFFVILVTAYIPFSPFPEKVFVRLLRRYFRSSEYLLSTLGDWQQHLNSREHSRQARHLREIATLPQKLAAWSRVIGPDLLPARSPIAVQQLVANLQALSFRIQELLSAQNRPYPPALIASLRADIGARRLAIRQVFQRLSVDPSDLDRQVFQARLVAAIDHMEQHVKAALDQPEQGRISDEEVAGFCQLLAAYRGVSVALEDYAGSVAPIDWPRWREERFA
jgi:uncharacterized membrane protein YccC